MKSRIAVCFVALGLVLPSRALAAPGILLLTDHGKPEWNTLVLQLATTVDKQKPTEVALWPAPTPSLQAAVDRLIQRGVSEIVVVPLFVAALPPDLTSAVRSSVPLRVTPGLNGDPVTSEIIASRTQENSRDAAAEVVVLVAHRSAPGDDRRWVPDLRAAAQRLHRARSFAAVVTTTIPAEASETSPSDVRALRAVLQRHIAEGRRIIVVPVLTPYGGTEAAIEEQLQGLAHEVAKSVVMSDDRLVAWIVSRVKEERER